MQCEACNRQFETASALASHFRQAHTKKRNLSGRNNPHYGHPGRNQWSDFDWSNVPFDMVGPHKKKELLKTEANNACTKCGYAKQRDDGFSILEMNHIDGDHKNNKRENLEILCPNCHALTPNYKNYGRTNKRTSTRLYRHKEVSAFVREQENKYKEQFIETVTRTHETGEIDYRKFGWVQKLANKLNDIPQKIGNRVKRWMPDFYMHECFAGKKRVYIKKTTS